MAKRCLGGLELVAGGLLLLFTVIVIGELMAAHWVDWFSQTTVISSLAVLGWHYRRHHQPQTSDAPHPELIP